MNIEQEVHERAHSISKTDLIFTKRISRMSGSTPNWIFVNKRFVQGDLKF